MTPYLTTESCIETIEVCERQKKDMERNLLSRLLNRKEIAKCEYAIKANIGYLHEFYPHTKDVTDVRVFSGWLRSGYLTPCYRSAVVGSPVMQGSPSPV